MAKIVKRKDAPKLETVKGRHGEILMAGEKCMMMINTIEPGLPTPPHSHPHEQIGYLQEGEGDLYIGDEKIHIKAQCSFVAPGRRPPQLRRHGRQARRPHRVLRAPEGGLPRARGERGEEEK